MKKYLFIISVVLLFAVGINLTAKDDLVKMQKKEEKRRKKIKKSVISITNENIIRLSRNSKKKVVRISGSNLQPSISQSTQIKSSEEGSMKKDEKYWRSEKINIENSIKFYEKKVSTLTSRLNKLITDSLNTDYIPAKNQIQADIKNTRLELSKSKQQVPYFKNKLEQFLEEAKRANIPPGWLR